jgi:hypothetical protein
MVGVDDLETYRRHNDIGPEDPAPRAPEGEPHRQTEAFDIWLFDAKASETVPDTYVVARDPDPLDFRMWVFAGKDDRCYFIMRASHKYGEDEAVEDGREDCCEVLMDGQSLKGRHCPTEAEAVVSELTGTDVIMPQTQSDDQGGPVSY